MDALSSCCRHLFNLFPRSQQDATQKTALLHDTSHTPILHLSAPHSVVSANHSIYLYQDTFHSFSGVVAGRFGSIGQLQNGRGEEANKQKVQVPLLRIVQFIIDGTGAGDIVWIF